MSTQTIPLLLCPVCQAPLTPHENQMIGCKNGHPFNRSKEGYYNLLLSHQRRSKIPGDDPTMVIARRRFFDSDAFDQLTEEVLQLPPIQQQPHTLLDCGCGEGHFLGAIGTQYAGRFIGADIAKKAIQYAARRHKHITWIVANGMRTLPIASASTDLILSILAPRNMDEFRRIITPKGALLLGVPGPNHLSELREKLQFSSGDFSEKADIASAKCAPLFKEIERYPICYSHKMSQIQLHDLIQMTPIFWRSNNDAKNQVMQLESLSVTISFIFILLRPTNPIG